jgi:hypothetical protein
LQQAYIQQLESSRIRLAQLEQELHTARAQVIGYIADFTTDEKDKVEMQCT